ncbi:MAG: hypothetical protein FWG90_10005 [Oscillospiraceae bacterium]|nr:hypothetical protein [Oscillospiraceae bacterium]
MFDFLYDKNLLSELIDDVEEKINEGFSFTNELSRVFDEIDKMFDKRIADNEEVEDWETWEKSENSSTYKPFIIHVGRNFAHRYRDISKVKFKMISLSSNILKRERTS